MNITKLNMVIYIIAGLSVSLIIADVLFEEPVQTVPNILQNKSNYNHTASPYAAMAKGYVDVETGVIKLAASRDGIIKKVLANEGDHVKSGQALAVPDIQEAKLSHRVAQAELEELTVGLRRLKIQLTAGYRERKRLAPLVASRAVAKRELDQTKDQIKILEAEIASQQAAIETARARLRVSEYEIELRTIRAPTEGYVAKRLARPGDGASTLSVTPLFWFIPKGPLIIRAEVDEEFIDKIKVGMTADIATIVNETRQYRATVLRIGRALGPKQPTVYDPRERADIRVVECDLELDDSPGQLILGQRVIVKIIKPVHANLPSDKEVKL